MTRNRARQGQLHILAVFTAFVAMVGIGVTMSSTDGYLATAMQKYDDRLEAISERAERIQTLSRHIRKASLMQRPDVQLPFGGFVGAASQIEPGAQLTLRRHAGAAGTQIVEVVSAHQVAPTLDFATSTTQSIDLMLVTGRVVDAPNGAPIRFLVAVTPEPPATSTSDQRSL